MRKRRTPHYTYTRQKPFNLKLDEMEWIYLTSALEWCVKHTHTQATASVAIAMSSRYTVLPNEMNWKIKEHTAK